MPIVKQDHFIGFKDQHNTVLCSQCINELEPENPTVITAKEIKDDEMVICDHCGAILRGE